MRIFSFFILTLFIMIVAGCGQGGTGMVYAPPALEEGWSVKLTVSGGIAGWLKYVEVYSDGQYTVKDERSGKSSEGSLSQKDLADLEQILAALQVRSTQAEKTCADCFEYEVVVSSAGRKMIANADDKTLEDAGLGRLVDFLLEKMNEVSQ